jgi:hypothetical protein
MTHLSFVIHGIVLCTKKKKEEDLIILSVPPCEVGESSLVAGGPRESIAAAKVQDVQLGVGGLEHKSSKSFLLQMWFF